MSIATLTAPVRRLRAGELVIFAGVALLCAVIAARNDVVSWSVAAGVTIVIGAAVMRARRREQVMWLVLAVCAFNFLPALFTSERLTGELGPEKLIKDVPVVLWVITALLVRGERTEPTRMRPWLYCWAVFLIVEAARATYPAVAAVSIRYYLVYPLAGLAMWRLQLTRPEVIRILRFVVALGVVVGIIAIVESRGSLGTTTAYANYASIDGHRVTRAIGTLGNPDNLGLFLGLPALLIIETFRSRVLIRSRALALGALAVIMAAIALSFSKAVPIALVLALVIAARPYWRRALRLVVFGALGGALFVFASQARGMSLTTQDILSGRQYLVAPVLAEIQDTPTTLYFGGGLGAAVQVFTDREVQSLTSDNFFLGLALEVGVVGVCLFAVGVLIATRPLWRLRTSGPLPRALWAYGVFFLVYTPVYTNFTLFPAAMIFWLLPALAAAAVAEHDKALPAPTT